MGYVDIMSTMSNNMFCTLYLSCYELRWTIPLLISIANYIFSLLKAIHSVVFAFVCHHF